MIDCSGAWIHIDCGGCGETFEYPLNEMDHGNHVFDYVAMIKELQTNGWTADGDRVYCEICSQQANASE